MLIASNFDALEHRSEMSKLSDYNFITNYVFDHTQGPIASMCAPYATIFRAFNPIKINMLEKCKMYSVVNGYASINEKYLLSSHPTIVATDDFTAVIHQNVAICDDLYKFQVVNYVDQVFVSAINVKQRDTGKLNYQLGLKYPNLIKYVICSGYHAAYLAAILNKRENLILTLIGGGVFGNSIKLILDELLRMHNHFKTIGFGNIKNIYINVYKASMKTKKYVQNRLCEFNTN